MAQRDRLVQCYFRFGLSNKEILESLAQLHGIVISKRTLQRITTKLSLFRRKEQTNLLDVALYITQQCEESGQSHGYRWMHLKCIHEGFVVSQECVRCLLAIIDPEGVDKRKKRRLRRRQYASPGPNFVWHMDG
jgi:hypothetical protein